MSDYTHDSLGMKLEMGGDLLRRQFDPTAHDLDANFRLTRFADLKGRGCKVPQDVLNKLVGSLQQDYTSHDDQFMHMAIPRIGIGLDCSVTPLRHGGLCLVQTTDFFYPIVDDPYMMGKIACANVLSDLYAMGVIECDNMLMLLAVSTKMTEKERDVVIPLIMRGFKVSKEIKANYLGLFSIDLSSTGFSAGSRNDSDWWSKCRESMVHDWRSCIDNMQPERLYCA